MLQTLQATQWTALGTVTAALIAAIMVVVGVRNQRRLLTEQQQYDRQEKRRAELRTACLELLALSASLISKRHWLERKDGPLARARAKEHKSDDDAQLRYHDAVNEVTQKVQAVLLLGSPALAKAANEMVDELNPFLNALADHLALMPTERFQAACDKYNAARDNFFRLARKEVGLDEVPK